MQIRKTPKYWHCYTLLVFLYILLTPDCAWAQKTIKGVIKDANTKEALVGASILVQKSNKGAITDIRGEFVIQTDSLPATLLISYVGYQPAQVEVKEYQTLEIFLNGLGAEGDQIVLGNRFIGRSQVDAPVPIDNLSIEDLRATGQTTLAQMLMYALPAFNSTQQTVSDGTAHFDPTDLRGLGPSRTLVLINGKRRHSSALAYINDTPGKGEVGVDWRSIPLASIKRVEVLRDGASAQYGSDAIAGVINIVLKDGYDPSSARAFWGLTTEGDGTEMGYDLNLGFKLGNRGNIHISSNFHEQRETNRPGSPGEDLLIGVGADNPWIQQNPSLGMQVGQPYMATASLYFNAEANASPLHELYAFGGVSYRTGVSYALYRAPYWVPDPNFLLHSPNETYDGFLPTFEADIQDQMLVLGSKGSLGKWKYDLSIDWGKNTVDYIVGNSLNPSLGANSPTDFEVGGFGFSHVVSNMDFGRKFGSVSISFGSELRRETFTAIEGEEDSYIGAGTQSFPGLQPENAVEATRFNAGGYAEIDWEVTKSLLLVSALRFERYSDFGDNFTWKVNARYRPTDWSIIRASASTGFRAPSLHQIYLSSTQSVVSGGTVSRQGTFNNLNPVVRALDVPSLTQEKSFNISAGIGVNLNQNFSITADYYRISLDGRIVFTGNIASNDTTTAVGQILRNSNITSLKVFLNAAQTRSSGLDIVASYRNIPLGKGKLEAVFSANFSQHDLIGTVDTPEPILEAGVDIFDRKEQSRILTGRPNHKLHLRLQYRQENWMFSLLNTRFGSLTWQHAQDPGKDQTFSPRLITDIQVRWEFLKNINASLSINNLLNVYPDEIDNKGDILTDLGERFKYGWDMNQFGYKGTFISLAFGAKF